jgi:hypothetical protein
MCLFVKVYDLAGDKIFVPDSGFHASLALKGVYAVNEPRGHCDRKEDTMKLQHRFAAYAVPLLAAAIAPSAMAGCGDVRNLQTAIVFAQPAANAQAITQRASEAARAAAASGAMSGASMSNASSAASIVGFWKIQLLSQGNTSRNPPIPDGAVVDFGYTQWHSDGTEIFNSGARAPATENFCLGVWARSGFLTYELNHFALSYDATSGVLNGKVNIQEQVTLDPSGELFTGTFTINIYDPTTGQQVDHIVGTVSASRVSVDDTTP